MAITRDIDPSRRFSVINGRMDWYEITFKGVFSLGSLYKMMHDWLRVHKFVSRDGTKNIEQFEEYYYEKTLPGGGAKNMWMWWRVEKQPPTDMFLYHVNIEFQVLAIKEKEVMYQGKKVKMDEGEVTVRIFGDLLVDPHGEWKKNWIARAKTFTFRKKFYEEQTDVREIELNTFLVELANEIKQFLGMLTNVRVEKPFHPELGYPQQV
ncbi:MAG: hypothetical protein ACI8Y7_000818 [Candidatus Woesearchaeota archaeon]|jgi:hypothetical protein